MRRSTLSTGPPRSSMAAVTRNARCLLWFVGLCTDLQGVPWAWNRACTNRITATDKRSMALGSHRSSRRAKKSGTIPLTGGRVAATQLHMQPALATRHRPSLPLRAGGKWWTSGAACSSLRLSHRLRISGGLRRRPLLHLPRVGWA